MRRIGPAPFRFAPTFKIDLVFSLVYVALFVWTWAHGGHRLWHCAVAGLFGFLLVLCYAGKVAIIGFLNQRGGDARTYVISSGLVTTGLYAYSRNPTYLLTLVQCVRLVGADRLPAACRAASSRSSWRWRCCCRSPFSCSTIW